MPPSPTFCLHICPRTLQKGVFADPPLLTPPPLYLPPLQPSLGPVTLHGSLLLQHLLHFGDPGPVLGGLEALPPTALAALARSPPGSRIWDALLTSPTVPPRARRHLLRKLKVRRGGPPPLPQHRFGVRSPFLGILVAVSSPPPNQMSVSRLPIVL